MPQREEEFGDQPLSGKTILLAEDEERLRIIVAMMLEELGAEVVTVSDGAGAVETYEEQPAKFDLVFLDLRMKGLDGDNAFSKMLEIDPTVKVVLCSGVTPDDELLGRLSEHGGGFIEKPFNIEKLGDVLSQALYGDNPS